MAVGHRSSRRRLARAGGGRGGGRASGRQARRARRAIALMRRAALAHLSDPLRTGNLIDLPLVGEVLVSGDVHGNRKNLERIVELADLAENPRRHLILQEFVHALELSPGGLDLSFLTLERQAELKCAFPDRVHVLLGNHELSEFQGRKVYKDGKMLNSLFHKGVAANYGADTPAVKEAYRRYFRSLPLAARTRTRVFFCHSTPERPHVRRYNLQFFMRPPNLYDVVQRGLVEELVWGRDYAPEVADELAERLGAEVLVVGHEPCDDGYRVPNHRHVIIDSKDDNGVYMLLRLNQPYSQKGVIRKICRLWP